MKGKPIQVAVSGVEEHQGTQCSVVIIMLTDAWEIFRKKWFDKENDWEELENPS